MQLPSFVLAVFKGHKLQSSVNVKNITMAVNVVSAIAVGASHAGLVSMTPDQINGVAGHVLGIIPMFLPYVLAFNVYSGAATSETVGLSK